MSSIPLSNRDNWERLTERTSKGAEKIVTKALQEILPSDKYIVKSQIRDFEDKYSEVVLPNHITKKINNVDPQKVRRGKWGWVPDNSITNRKTGKTIFIEVKHQDGWVKGGYPSDGRGNAHERGLKHFAPGIMQAEKKASGITDGFLPFILLLTGEITVDPRRNRELYYWFKGHEFNYFMWHYNSNIFNKTKYRKNNTSKYGKEVGEEIYDKNDLKKFLFNHILKHLD